VVSAVFLDRDGVINANIVRNGRPFAPTALEQFHLLPGVHDAVQKLKSAGFLVIVVTNQPDVRTGRTPQEVVEAMHADIRRQMPVDAIRACYHVDADRCNCRKPKPGLIVDAAREFGVDLASSYVVGDRWRDTAAGKAAGCSTVFVDYGYEQDGPNHPDIVVRSLPEAAARILERKKQVSVQAGLADDQHKS
jgi:D-glycero-D-manno-heptose 1,7-bisphosphate phosphatase